ncbi:unnamed protein product [Oppiella nova]|uniref:Zinc phosphodiesterase ELAC protein 2 n=1 Tax=Oppiella nova TaxID=334625 RepID=A0A7R9LFZ1_9ACAR|nr:unnamed protein product [Oppiella nova]CAG2163288.1 unnamed protein product [Oppiella nova]
MATFGIKCNTCLTNRSKHLFINCWKHFSYNRLNTTAKEEEMPKDKSHLLQKLRDNRMKSAKKTAKNTLASNVFQLSVVGNGSKGNPRALYVWTDRNSYLFNCGEGTQRLANEHKLVITGHHMHFILKLSKLENIFITRRCIENMSGIVGLALTCQDIGVPNITLHGPQHIDRLLSLYHHFLTFSGMKIQTNSYIDYHFEDTDLAIRCLPIQASVAVEDNSKNTSKVSNEISFIYICKLKDRPGELLIKKCIELKVPPGPLLGKLKAGQDIVLSDNRVICSKDVMGPEDKGPIFIVLECPSLQYIDSLLSNESILQSLSNESSNLVSVVVHFTPSDVFTDERYQQWMKRLGDSVEHLIVNEDNPKQSYVGSNRLQIQLNLIDSFIFPLLDCLRNEDTPQAYQSNSVRNTNTLSKYHLRPSNVKGYDSENIVDIDVNAFKEEAFSNSEFMESLKKYHSLESQLQYTAQDYPEIIFLGTGSAVPSKVRNTSAIWLNIDSETSFLLDCGEGTFGQLSRFYGKECDSRLKQLKAIYVSHLHADHHLGILQLLKKRSLVTDEPLLLIIPPAVINWLQNYNECVEQISHMFEIIAIKKFLTESDDKVLKRLRLKELRTCLVPHCSHSYGVSLTTKSEPNFKVVYSGDTQPTPNLTRIGLNCDLLIHEASMEDQLVDEARLKFHSTTSEAIDVGKDMNAKFTILTHFSQRYAKIPVFNENFNDRVGIAFDNMRVRMSDLNKLPKMIPTLKCLFNEQIEELKARSAHTLRRKEVLSQYRDNKT